MGFLYNIFIFLYSLSIRIASLFNSKAKLWVDGRKNVFGHLEDSGIIGKPIIWIHSASLGEFEQGRPIIDRLRITYPEHKILVTFFSPSGYEVRKNYRDADHICYLPIDTKRNARRFISMIRPQLVIFIKYEFWFNYINEIYNHRIPLIFASVIFRPSQHFFKPWGRWSARQLNRITHLFVQNEESVNLLDGIKIYHSSLSGDTRFDRVISLPDENKSFPMIEEFKGKTKLLIGGSTWPSGEKILQRLLDDSEFDFKLVIAPHLIDGDHLSEILKRFSKFHPVLYSKAKLANLVESKVMIIDSIGMLSSIYKYADIAYVGGGFGVGIHNLLEASTYGIPVIYGPNYSRFREAVDLRDIGGGFPINNHEECLTIFGKLMSDTEFYSHSAKVSRDYVEKNSGATKMVVDKVMEFIPVR